MRIPTLRYHKASRQGRVTLNDKTLYCGPWGGPAEQSACEACQIKYKAFIARWLETGRGQLPTIAEVVTRFMAHAADRYPGPGHNETINYKYALRHLGGILQVGSSQIYLPGAPAAAFTCDWLEAIMEQMRVQGYARTYANQTAKRILRVFKWARRKSLISAACWADLQNYESVRSGSRGWYEKPKTAAVPEEHIAAARARVSPSIWDIIELCRLIPNSRVGEILSMRSGGLDTRDEPWVYDLGYGHKTGYRGIGKRLFIGSAAQAIVIRYLQLELDAPLFTHRRSSIWTALSRACRAAGVTAWTVHQLRKNSASDALAREARKLAKALMDHRSDASSKVYAPDDIVKRELARLAG